MPFSLLSSGSNAHGQLSNGTLDDSHKFTACIFTHDSCSSSESSKILHIASGANHTLLLSEEATSTSTGARRHIWGCGDGSAGQLGNLWREKKKDETILQKHGLDGYQPRLICASWETSYVVLSCEERPDVLISMGSNDFGDLGVGPVRTKKLFHIVQFNHLHVDGLVLDGDSMQVISVAAGQHHVMARIPRPAQRRVPPPYSDPEQVSIPSQDHRNTKCDPVISFALGTQHSILHHQTGRLSCLGSNKKAQMTNLDSDAFRDVSFVGCTWNGTYFLDGPVLYATGSHSKGQLGRRVISSEPHPVEFPFDISTREELKKIACGSEHVLALRLEAGADGDSPPEVWGWGWNEHGNLGLGMTSDVHTPTKLWPVASGAQETETMGFKAVGIWAGCGTSWIALEKEA
ncbi:RCC1/BLIP-II [Gymnopus androsaceus JB14]|uniref:RCC1/BLIP-II n=1 Tax=Gymnopus androsaceus JB14 TaxID=1447944 RepID=A0A6A4HMN8_9AGAR|nr:RCC1/BLIP-II [Gymnopus androsaceus JB14]